MAENQKPKKKGVSKKVIAAAILAIVIGILLAPKIKRALPKNVQKKIDKLGKDISQRAARAGQLTRAKYEEIVDAATKSYAKGKEIGEKELKVVSKELKKHWGRIQKRIK